MSNLKNRFIHNSKTKSGAVDILIISSRPGYRQKSKGCVSLIKHEKETVINQQISVLNSSFKGQDKYISVGFESNKLIKEKPDNLRVIENQSFEETNVVEDIRLFLNNSLNDSALVIMGNVIFDKKIINNINLTKSVIFSCTEGYEDPRILRIDNDFIRMNYEKTIDDIWSGLCYFTGNEYSLLKRFCSKKNGDKLITECINFIVDNGGKFNIVDGEVTKL